MRVAIAVLAFMASAVPVAAQEAVRWTLAGNAGISILQEKPGLSFAIGSEATWRQFVGFGMLDLAIVAAEGGSRYQWDYLSNGQKRCRDTETGQFASSTLCAGGDPRWAAMIDSSIRIPIEDGINSTLGGGIRLASPTTLYGVAGLEGRFDSGIPWFGRLALGPSFIQVHFGAVLGR